MTLTRDLFAAMTPALLERRRAKLAAVVEALAVDHARRYHAPFAAQVHTRPAPARLPVDRCAWLRLEILERESRGWTLRGAL